ncbi:hypothetical protein [Roseibium sediminis]|uniref:hypothetical protein n=1 Tax=Roseibium sediminis TaxID=1775174 RepID=UPI00123CD7F1|nr:hypothetical protein [Roseibium sediminis]
MNGNAVWLFFAVPEWYFEAAFSPFSAGALSQIPLFGVISLMIGLVSGAVLKRKALFFLAILPLLSQLLLIVAGVYRGQLKDGSDQPILLAFIVIQILVAVLLIYRLRGARLPAFALSVFSITYAFFAAFVATMSFQDVWL